MLARAFVALGSNLPGHWGTNEDTLRVALQSLGNSGFSVLRASNVWRSAAWPNPADPEFLNQVVLVATAHYPLSALRALGGLEEAFGRARTYRNAPRRLDLDLIDYSGRVWDTPELTLPHPRAHERLFVMGPLAEIAPGWRHPVLGLSAAELSEEATVGRDARPLPRPGSSPGSRIAT